MFPSPSELMLAQFACLLFTNSATGWLRILGSGKPLRNFLCALIQQLYQYNYFCFVWKPVWGQRKQCIYPIIDVKAETIPGLHRHRMHRDLLLPIISSPCCPSTPLARCWNSLLRRRKVAGDQIPAQRSLMDQSANWKRMPRIHPRV